MLLYGARLRLVVSASLVGMAILFYLGCNMVTFMFKVLVIDIIVLFFEEGMMHAFGILSLLWFSICVGLLD